MSFNDYLLEGDRYKLYILEFIEASSTTEVSIDSLCEFLGLSKFKTQNYIEQLSNDVQSHAPQTTIFLTESNVFYWENVNLEMIRLQRLYYIKKSPIFLLLHETIQSDFLMEEFANKHFISESIAYKTKQKLNTILKEQNISIKQKKLVGSELEIRAYLFELYYYFFNGFEFPFSDRVFSIVKESITHIVGLNTSNLSLTQQIKLELFLAIQQIRINDNQELNSDISYSTNLFSSEIFSEIEHFYTKTYFLMGNPLHFEIHYLEAILSSNDFAATESFDQTMTVPLSHAFLLHIKETVSFIPPFVFSEESVEWNQIRKDVDKIHLLLELKHFAASSFISSEQIYYFEENYPIFHRLSKIFVDEIVTKNFPNLADEKKISLYYDYLFVLIRYLPIKFVDTPTWICVDFSNGENYTNFIASSIRSFRDLNIEIQKIPDEKTAVFVSDFSIAQLNCAQIIWKNPPSANDWKIFANTVISHKLDSGGIPTEIQ